MLIIISYILIINTGILLTSTVETRTGSALGGGYTDPAVQSGAGRERRSVDMVMAAFHLITIWWIVGVA